MRKMVEKKNERKRERARGCWRSDICEVNKEPVRYEARKVASDGRYKREATIKDRYEESYRSGLTW